VFWSRAQSYVRLYRVIQKVKTGLVLASNFSNLYQFAKFFRSVKEEEIFLESHITRAVRKSRIHYRRDYRDFRRVP